MNRHDWRDLYQWLDTADLEEWREKLQKIEAVLPLLRDFEIRGEALKMRHEIEAELLDQLARR